MLLHAGFEPAVASSTGVYLVFMSAFSACIPFLISGSLRIDYGLAVFVVSIVASVIGIKATDKLVHKYNKPSIMVIILASFMIFVFFSVTATSVKGMVDQVNEGKIGYLTVDSVC